MKTIDGFEIDYKQQLGKGSFANIYACSNTKFQIPLCVKEIQYSQQDQEQTQNIQREIQILQYLQKHGNENIIKIISVSNHTINKMNYCYIFMERCLQGDIDKQFKLRKKLKKFYSIEEILEKLEQILNGYQLLYDSGIIHRDLKPENILLGNDKKLKISDFGFGRIFEKQQLLKQQQLSMVGTPNYASPQVLFSGIYTNKSDVYSLGIIIYHMIFLELPFKCASFMELIAWQKDKLQNKVLVVPPFPQSDHEIEKNHLKKFLENTITYDEEKRYSWDDVFYLFQKNKKKTLLNRNNSALLSTQSSLQQEFSKSLVVSQIIPSKALYNLVHILQQRQEIVSQLSNYLILFQEKYKSYVSEQELEAMLTILYGYQLEVSQNQMSFILGIQQFCPEISMILNINNIDQEVKESYKKSQNEKDQIQFQIAQKNHKIFKFYYQNQCDKLKKVITPNRNTTIIKQILQKNLDGNYLYFKQLFFCYYTTQFEPKFKIILEIGQDLDTLIFFVLVRKFMNFDIEMPIQNLSIDQNINLSFQNANLEDLQHYIKNHQITGQNFQY